MTRGIKALAVVGLGLMFGGVWGLGGVGIGVSGVLAIGGFGLLVGTLLGLILVNV